MSDGAKIAAVAVGIAVVAYFVVSSNGTSATANRPASAAGNPVTAFINGVVTLGAAAFKTQPPTTVVPNNAPLANINTPLTTDQLATAQEFRSTDYSTMTDSERDTAILGN